jgi:hypothetical protein
MKTIEQQLYNPHGSIFHFWAFALGGYSGSNENFVLVRTGITAVLSFEW